MTRRTAVHICLFAGFLSATVAWYLVVSAPVSWTAGTLFLIGLVSAILIGRGLLTRGKALLNLWAGVLVGGLVQLGYQVLRHPLDAEGFVFDFLLASLVVALVAVIVSVGYLVGSFFGRRRVSNGE